MAIPGPPTRFPNGLGTLRSELSTNGDPYHIQFIVDLPLVASASAVGTGIFMPDYSLAHASLIRIISRSPSATAQISIGTLNDADLLTGGAAMSIGTQNVRVYESFNLPSISALADRNTGVGEEIHYTFSADDITGWVGQVMIVAIAWGELA